MVTEEGPGHTDVSFTANINVFNSDLTELILTAGAAGTLIVFFRGVAWSQRFTWQPSPLAAGAADIPGGLSNPVNKSTSGEASGPSILEKYKFGSLCGALEAK